MVIRRRKAAQTAKTAVAYVRMSKDEQKNSPESQRAAIEAWAKHEGITIAAWHADLGVTGSTPVADRPGLLAALTDVRERKATMLVVAKRDRLARDVVIAANVETLTKDVGAQVVSAGGEGNGDSPADGFLRHVVDAAAEYERGLIRARTKAALAAKRARGEAVSHAPYGFELATDGVHLQPCTREQNTINRALALHVEGATIRALTATLNDEGHRSRRGKPFTFQAVYSWLRPMLDAK